jgi:hypothetical protein
VSQFGPVGIARFEKVPEMKHWLIQYDMLDDGHPDKSYERLMIMVERCSMSLVTSSAWRPVKRDIDRFLKGGSPAVPASPGQETKGDPKKTPKSLRLSRRLPLRLRPVRRKESRSPADSSSSSTCKKGDACTYSHAPVSASEKKKLEKDWAPRASSAGNSPRAAPADKPDKKRSQISNTGSVSRGKEESDP